jgi:hypothetical protein
MGLNGEISGENEFMRYYKENFNEIVEFIESNKERKRRDTKNRDEKKMTRLFGNGRYHKMLIFVGIGEADNMREKQFLMEVLTQKIQSSESRLADITGNVYGRHL